MRTLLPPPAGHRQSATHSSPANLPSRRTVVRKATQAAGISALMAGLPKGWVGALYASDAPEKSTIRAGIVAVASCAPIVIAHEKGFFRKYGLTSSLSKENGWAAARDKIVSEENDCTHLKYSQGVASLLGAGGAPKIPMVSPWTLCRNGSAFLVSLKLKQRPGIDPKSWVPAIRSAAKDDSFTIATPIPVGFHAMLYRYFLATAGINADKDLKMITLPPAQMVQNMRVGAMSACGMVEPWGTRGVQENVAYIAFYGNDLWPEHPVKACTFLEKFTNKNPKTTVAILRALYDAAKFCDEMGNREEIARILSVTNYLNSSIESLRPFLMGKYVYGNGKTLDDQRHVIRFFKDNATYPQPKEMAWFITQLRRWGMLTDAPDYKAACQRVCRPDIYQEAMKGVGYTAFKQDDSPITFFDGKVYNPAEPEKYATSFAVNSMKG